MALGGLPGVSYGADAARQVAQRQGAQGLALRAQLIGALREEIRRLGVAGFPVNQRRHLRTVGRLQFRPEGRGRGACAVFELGRLGLEARPRSLDAGLFFVAEHAHHLAVSALGDAVEPRALVFVLSIDQDQSAHQPGVAVREQPRTHGRIRMRDQHEG